MISTFHVLLYVSPHPGGYNPDHEDEKTHQQRPAADRAGRDSKEHVFTTEEDDQGAN